MSNLRDNRLSFNKNVQISSKSEKLSSHGGLILVREFLEKIQFNKLLKFSQIHCKSTSFAIKLIYKKRRVFS